MLDDDIEPDIFLNLTYEMSESTCCYALNWRFILGERLEEIDYTFTYTNLFPLLMDISLLWIEVKYLDICEFLFSWFFGLGCQCRINDEDGANRYLAQKFTLLLQGCL